MANYADITKIEAPSEAASGSQVAIKVYIKNTASVTTGIMVGGALEYGVTPWPKMSFPNNQTNFPAGQTYYFTGYFTMPSVKVKIHAYSYYYSNGWYFDDEMTKDISVLSTWKKLDYGVITVIPTVIWRELDSGTMTVTPVVTEWKELGTFSLTVKPSVVELPPVPPPPPPQACSVDSDCPEGYVCKDGKCVKKEEETDWLPIALIGGGAVALMALSDRKPRRKSRAKKE